MEYALYLQYRLIDELTHVHPQKERPFVLGQVNAGAASICLKDMLVCCFNTDFLDIERRERIIQRGTRVEVSVGIYGDLEPAVIAWYEPFIPESGKLLIVEPRPVERAASAKRCRGPCKR